MTKENHKNKRKVILPIIFGLGVVFLFFGVSMAFFNYTRIGSPNTVATGRIYFNHQQGNTINLTNVFPISSEEAETDTEDSATVSITVTGDTDYDEGMEYVVTLSDVVNTVNNKKIPINLEVSVTGTGLGTEETGDYYTNRDSYTVSKYKKEYNGKTEDDRHILVGYIAPNTTKGTASGINGTINIKAYIDSSKVAVSDTYDGTESDAMGTTTQWVAGREGFTTSEWSNSELSFKIKVEAREGIWVEEPQLSGSEKVLKAISENATGTCSNIIYEEDGIKYFSGTNDCINFNYVWYSGKLWRITAIYPDESMKLVTENNITSIAFNESDNIFENSYMYQWLNEEFYPTLYHASEFIDTAKKWNATMPADTNISTKPAETNLVTTNVGLLNSYEYYNSYRNLEGYSNGYLNNGYMWWLLNPSKTSYVWSVSATGLSLDNYMTYVIAVRPSIILKSGITFNGNGTTDNPYKIVGDKNAGILDDLINTRISGEYVKLKNGSNEQLFRIINVEDGKTKIIAMDYADNKEEKKFTTKRKDILWGSGSTTAADTWYTYLNSTYLPNSKTTYGELFDSSTYYLGVSGNNYKLSVCANTVSGNMIVCDKTTDYGTFDIGLPRYGEMFATQQSGGKTNSIAMWLMNRSSNNGVWEINDYAFGISTDNQTYSISFAARPTLHLKSTVKIKSGSGIQSDPYVVGL